MDAVTASTALPGLVPTHSINGTHYINGGVRSGGNADLASGYANVVVLSPFRGRGRTPPDRGADPAGQFEGLRRPPEWGTDLASQVEALRDVSLTIARRRVRGRACRELFRLEVLSDLRRAGTFLGAFGGVPDWVWSGSVFVTPYL